MTEEEAKRVVQRIAATIGVELAFGKVEWPGASSYGFRLATLGVGRAFSIGLELIPRKAEAVLVMDRYAGATLRAMESSVSDSGSAWPSLAHDSETGVKVSIAINGMDFDPAVGLASSPWTSIEIECSKKIGRLDAAPLEALVEAGSVCLALVLDAIDLDLDVPDEIQEEGEKEGRMYQIQATKYERSPLNRLRCINHYGSTCWVCDADFRELYGPVGDGFIEVHHRTPVSIIGPDYRVDPVRDLIPLCSNCHSMIHRRNPPFSPPELRAMRGLESKEILSR